jgi:hypothetical protein
MPSFCGRLGAASAEGLREGPRLFVGGLAERLDEGDDTEDGTDESDAGGTLCGASVRGRCADVPFERASLASSREHSVAEADGSQHAERGHETDVGEREVGPLEEALGCHGDRGI